MTTSNSTLASLIQELGAQVPTDPDGALSVSANFVQTQVPTLKSHPWPLLDRVATALSEVAQFDRYSGITDSSPAQYAGAYAANLCTFKFIHHGKVAPRHPYPIRRDIDTFGVPVQFTRKYPKGMQYDDLFNERAPAGGTRDTITASDENEAAAEVYQCGTTCMVEDIGLCHPVHRLNAQHEIDTKARSIYATAHGASDRTLDDVLMAGALVPYITDIPVRSYRMHPVEPVEVSRIVANNAHAPRFHCDGMSVLDTNGYTLDVQLIAPRSTARSAAAVVAALPQQLASLCLNRARRAMQMGSSRNGKLPARADASIFALLVELDADTAIMILVPGALLIEPDHAKAMGVILGRRLMLLLDMHPFCRALRTPMEAIAPYADLLVAAKQLQGEGLALPTSWRWHDSISNMMGRKVVFAPCTPEAYAMYGSVLQRRFGDAIAHQFSQMVARTVEVDYRDVRGVRYTIDDFSVAMIKLAAALPTLTHVPLLSGMDLPTHATRPTYQIHHASSEAAATLYSMPTNPSQGSGAGIGSGNWVRPNATVKNTPEDSLTVTLAGAQLDAGATLTSDIMYNAAITALLEVYQGEPIATLAKRMPQSIALAARHGVSLNMRKLHMYYAKARESYAPTRAINNVNILESTTTTPTTAPHEAPNADH